MVISAFIIFYCIYEYLSFLTSFYGLGVYPVKAMGRPAETSLLTFLDAGDDETLALL